MTFKALPESTSYRDPGSGEFFQRRGTVSDFGRIEPLWQPSSMFNNYSSGPVRTGDLGGKYGAFFQEKSIDPLQAQSSLNNENELLAFGLPGISALLNRGLIGARILNPGSASAMTLDDAKRLGYYK